MGWKAAQKLIQNWKFLRGDNVMIIRGKDQGETGLIKRVVRSQNRIIVEGKNLIDNKQTTQTGIILTSNSRIQHSFSTTVTQQDNGIFVDGCSTDHNFRRTQKASWRLRRFLQPNEAVAKGGDRAIAIEKQG